MGWGLGYAVEGVPRLDRRSGAVALNFFDRGDDANSQFDQSLWVAEFLRPDFIGRG